MRYFLQAHSNNLGHVSVTQIDFVSLYKTLGALSNVWSESVTLSGSDGRQMMLTGWRLLVWTWWTSASPTLHVSSFSKPAAAYSGWLCLGLPGSSVWRHLVDTSHTWKFSHFIQGQRKACVKHTAARGQKFNYLSKSDFLIQVKNCKKIIHFW